MKKRNTMLITVLSISMLIVMVFNSCDPPTEAETTGSIEGIVYDASSSQQLGGVTVTTEPITSSKITDTNGGFMIEGVEPETYTLQAAKSGFNTNSTTVMVVAGETTTADLQLEPLAPELSVSTVLLNYGTSATNLTFTITNSGIGTLTWNVISTANWIAVNPANGSTESESDVVSVTVDRTAMSFGNHYETITIASNANSKTIDVLMTIQNPNVPQLSVYPVSMDFGNSETQMSFNIQNTGSGLLTWNVTDDKSWLSVLPHSGTTESEVDELVVTIDRLNQSSGTYTGSITVSSDGGNQNISVSFTIPDEPTLSVAPSILEFGSSESTMSFTVANAGSGELNWSVSDNQEWITTSPSSGVGYGTVNVSISREGLEIGDYSGSVTVSSNGGTGDIEISINIPEDQAPDAVILNDPAEITFNSMGLSWSVSEASDFYAYQLYRGTTASVDENSILITTVTNRYTLSYSATTLTEGTEYYFRLYVVDASGQTSGSNIVNATTLVEPGTWGVQTTINQNIDLFGIDVLHEDFAVAVGELGKVYFYNGSNWTEQVNMATETLRDVSIIAEDNIYIVGDEGVFYFNGTIWNRPTGEPPTTRCYCIDYADDSNVWVGADSSTIWHFNGTNWVEISTGNVISYFADIQIDDSQTGWAIENQMGKVYRYNGYAWSEYVRIQSWANGFAVMSTSEIWTANWADDHSNISYWDGISTFEMGAYSNFSFYAVAGQSSDNVWVVGESGHIRHWNGTEMMAFPSPTSNTLNAIKMITTEDGWAVGNNGVVLRYH
ncbi:MAG: carboxypeptidase regulatory-like domain-containing protein [Candidatus Marinimicrobia bacterium]|nr:carboxypeptidase regulatory-like domain-containing protein [Candidatus Neomarinimicrobiota bacterium]